MLLQQFLEEAETHCGETELHPIVEGPDITFFHNPEENYTIVTNFRNILSDEKFKRIEYKGDICVKVGRNELQLYEKRRISGNFGITIQEESDGTIVLSLKL